MPSTTPTKDIVADMKRRLAAAESGDTRFKDSEYGQGVLARRKADSDARAAGSLRVSEGRIYSPLTGHSFIQIGRAHV